MNTECRHKDKTIIHVVTTRKGEVLTAWTCKECKAIGVDEETDQEILNAKK